MNFNRFETDQDKNVIYLNLNNCRLEDLSPISNHILSIENLNELNLHSNFLETLSDNFSRLKVKKLNLGSNFLKEIPECIFGISTLEEVYLNDNLLENISSNIEELKNLKKINLYHNKLREIPEELLNLENLTEIDVRENPLTKRIQKENCRIIY